MYNLVIGLEISKSTLDASCVRFGSSVAQHDAFLNKMLGFKQLLKWIDTFKSDKDKVLICMEHTGYYAHKLTDFLRKKAYDVAQINPLRIKRNGSTSRKIRPGGC